MGALLTVDLPADSPVRDLPWIITIGPLHDDEEWEPVVCGPYERAHALSLAESVVADDDLMAVVEPLLPLVDTAAIHGEIARARDATGGDALTAHLDDPDGDHDARPDRGEPPTGEQVRAGFARIAAMLTGW